MATRQRKTNGEDLPPKREGKATRDVHPPLHNVNLSTISASFDSFNIVLY